MSEQEWLELIARANIAGFQGLRVVGVNPPQNATESGGKLICAAVEYKTASERTW